MGRAGFTISGSYLEDYASYLKGQVERLEVSVADARQASQRDLEARRQAHHALRAALATWCPNDPGGDGADAETFRLILQALGEPCPTTSKS